jgi:hypothetical protein
MLAPNMDFMIVTYKRGGGDGLVSIMNLHVKTVFRFGGGCGGGGNGGPFNIWVKLEVLVWAGHLFRNRKTSGVSLGMLFFFV